MFHRTTSITVPAAFAAAVLASTATADFIGLAAEKTTTADAAANDLWTVDVFAVFNDADDVLLAVTYGEADTNQDEFFQFSWFGFTGDFAPNEGGGNVMIPSDSFVTIGVELDDGSDQTSACPVVAFDNNHFAGAWCVPGNSDQGEAAQYADEYGEGPYRVRLMRLTTDQAGFGNGASIWGEIDLHYLDNGLQPVNRSEAFVRNQYALPGGIWENWNGNGSGGDGVPHLPIGSATITPSGVCPSCTLSVSNIGSSGDDGVRLGGFELDSFAMRWLPVDPLPEGAFIELRPTGRLGDLDGQPLGRLRVTQAASEVANTELSADFSALGSDTVTLRVYDAAGQLQAQSTGVPTSGIIGYTIIHPTGASFVDDGAGRGFAFDWSTALGISIPGGYGVGTRLLVVPENPSAPLTTIDSFGVAMTGVGGLVIADETGTSPAASCPADITGPTGAADGNVDALDFLLLIAQWGSPCAGSCAADITGPVPLTADGNVDALDFLLLMAQWGSPAACP